MKQIIIAVMGLTLFLIIVTSAPSTKPEESSHLGSIYWANPDGSRGLVTMTARSPSRPTLHVDGYGWSPGHSPTRSWPIIGDTLCVGKSGRISV